MPDVREYVTWNVEKLSVRLSEIVTELTGSIDELAMVESQELEQKIDAYHRSIETSDAARKRDAERYTHHLTTSAIELKARIAALTEEKFFVLRLIEWRSSS